MLFTSKIFRRFLVVFLALSLIPSIIAALVILRYSIAEVHKQSLTQLHILAESVESQVLKQLVYLKDKTTEFSSDKFIINTVTKYYRNPTYKQIIDHLNRYVTFAKLPTFPECIETFIMDINGMVIASSSAPNIGKDLSNTDYFFHGQKSAYASDIFREKGTGQITWIVSAPLVDKPGGKLVGVLADRINPQTLSDITTGRDLFAVGGKSKSVQIGKTGEVYIVNRDKVMITESRFLDDVALKMSVDTKLVSHTVTKGEICMDNHLDYRGVPVIGASKFIQEMGWIIIAEMDYKEAFAHIRRLQTIILIGIGILIPGIFFTTWVITYRFTRPIMRLIQADSAVIQGNQTLSIIPDHEIPAHELGDVMQSRNKMLLNLKEMKVLTQSQEKYRLLVENIPDIVWTSDQNGNTTFIDSKVEKVCGYTPEEYYKSADTWFGSIHPEDIETLKETYAALFTANKKYDIEYRLKKKDGTWIWVHDRSIKIYEKDGVMYADGIFSDITVRKQAEDALRRRVEFEKTVALISTRFVTLSEFDHAVSTSLADAGRLCGAGRAYLFQFRDNGNIMDNTHEWCDVGVTAEMQNLQNIPSTTFPWLMDNLRNGHVVHINDVSRMPSDAVAEKAEFEREDIKSIVVLPIYGEKIGFAGELAGFVGFDNVKAAVPWHEDDIAMLGIMAEIIGTAIARKQSEERIRHMAYHDGLTNLPNRILFHDRLKVSLFHAKRNKRIVSVMMLDMDKFKTVNDTLGHPIGDMLLKVVAERLIHCVREGDTVARMGGDEFIIVLPDLAQVHDAALVAQKILDALRQPFHINSHEIHTTASMGISIYPFNTDDPDTLIKQADIAMYVSKEKGRNTCHFHKPEINSDA